jgi:Leucine-rich repeat (LRR) protein
VTSLPALEQLDLGRNPRLATVPASIGSLVALTRLDLDYTAVTTLPEAIGNLRALKTLVLVGCPLAPGELERIRALVPADCAVEY